MKRLTALCTAVVGVATIAILPVIPAGAQAGFGRGAQHGARHAGGGGWMKWANQLNLTEDQRGRIRSIMEETREKVRALRANSALKPEERKEQIKELHKDAMQRVMTVLTPEQREKLKQIRRERRDHREDRRDKAGV